MKCEIELIRSIRSIFYIIMPFVIINIIKKNIINDDGTKIFYYFVVIRIMMPNHIHIMLYNKQCNNNEKNEERERKEKFSAFFFYCIQIFTKTSFLE